MENRMLVWYADTLLNRIYRPGLNGLRNMANITYTRLLYLITERKATIIEKTEKMFVLYCYSVILTLHKIIIFLLLPLLITQPKEAAIKLISSFSYLIRLNYENGIIIS